MLLKLMIYHLVLNSTVLLYYYILYTLVYIKLLLALITDCFLYGRSPLLLFSDNISYVIDIRSFSTILRKEYCYYMEFVL